MAAVTLTTLRARARERADQPVAGFVADSATGLDAWINEGVQKLHEMLVKAYGEQFLETSAVLTTVAGTTDYNLPTDMLVFYGAELVIGGITMVLRPYNNAERALHVNRLTYAGQLPRYKLVGMATGVIRLLPAPAAVYTGKILYAPSATLLVNASDSVNYPNGWERYVVNYAAIQMMLKEESDARPLQAILKEQEQELAEIAQRRNADQPHSIVDLDMLDNESPLDYF